ncbi:MAG: PSD1 and planctomycete cytochrome C domain-containing protein [Planctomycetota bacterium]|nr:PSD1 and planctomycete cytochrome C domain-containing protein [Planctomycetota bacterium]
MHPFLIPWSLARTIALSILLQAISPAISPAIATASGQEKQPTQSEKLFALKVQPLFQTRCLPCHGEKPDEIEGGFDIRSRESFLRGGDEFGIRILEPGKPDGSHLLLLITREEEGYEMPPKEADRLTDSEIKAVREWIQGGAPWPDRKRVARIYSEHAEGICWKTSGGLSQEWSLRKYRPEDLWAYRPLKQVKQQEPPGGAKNTIDDFIDRKLSEAGFQPAAIADRKTLIRRATFDLLGLPPTPKQVSQFVNDPENDQRAFATLVDRLLKSGHYGEQWGRHWLDVVRYADSSGFANDFERPNSWRYRDYVIRSLNQDKPYDQFVREQLAGDEIAATLENPDPKSNPVAAELLVAAGFLRMGPWEHTGMSVARVTRQQFLDDITDSVGQVFLAHPLQCCRCHDHKFDPVPTRDYYSIQSVFATTQFAEVDTAWIPGENRSFIEDAWKYKDRKIEANNRLKQQLEERQAGYIREWFQSRNLPYRTVSEARKAGISPEQLPPRRYGWKPDDYGQERVTRKWSQRLTWEKDRYRPIAFTVYTGNTTVKNSNRGRLPKPARPFEGGYLEKTAILKGGDVGSPGESVAPGILSATGNSHDLPKQPQGRRLAFANWLMKKENPLVARVMVNRIWQYHFGRGLAGNPNNFGATGKKPTHPLLLDWLAGEFIRSGWSIKKMHRLIMNSRTYQRSLVHKQKRKLMEMDPGNRLYAYFEQRQLSAEELRDSMLAITGELNRDQGGIPCRPDIHIEAALQPRLVMGTFAPSYVPNPLPAQRNRRSIYALRLRGQRDPFMELFNQPGSEKSCELRDQSMVSPQALTLLNGGESNERAIALAVRVSGEAATAAEAIRRLYQLAYARLPEPSELENALSAWDRFTEIEKHIRYQADTFPRRVTRVANEENTGEEFSFTEELVEYEDYVADRQPHEVDAKIRGLANICLGILNSNEFLFID